LFLYMWIAAGATYAGGTLNTSWNNNTNRVTGITNYLDSTSNEIYFTGFQLEVGDTATPFEHRSYGEELAACQRYFYKWTSSGLSDHYNFYSPYTPAQVTAGLPNSSAISPMTFPTTMRVAPTVTGTVANGSLNRATSTPFGVVFQMASTGTGTNYPTAFSATAEI
jgi:hypothetical protein